MFLQVEPLWTLHTLSILLNQTSERSRGKGCMLSALSSQSIGLKLGLKPLGTSGIPGIPRKRSTSRPGLRETSTSLFHQKKRSSLLEYTTSAWYLVFPLGRIDSLFQVEINQDMILPVPIISTRSAFTCGCEAGCGPRVPDVTPAAKGFFTSPFSFKSN